jgi:cysteine synthase B
MLQTITKPLQADFPNPIHDPNDLTAQVGNTPLLRLKHIEVEAQLPPAVRLYAKAEWFNPSGSVKDRPALNIIRTAEEEGFLRPGMTLLDSTSGNMGIAYAMFGASLGYSIRLTIPQNASRERIAAIRAYGAEVILTDLLEGSDGALRHVRKLAEEAGDDVFYAAQYDNPANWKAHYYTTANEIWSQSHGQVTHFVAGMGTSGTFVGTSRRLKELNTAVSCVSVQPDSPFNGLEGLKHMQSAIKPGIYQPELADSEAVVRTEDAYEMARTLARREGLFVGFSSAAAVKAAVKIARDLTSAAIVTILPDNGYKYIGERFWQE